MGFSFRSLYTDDDRPGQELGGSLPAAVSVSNPVSSDRLEPHRPAVAGIPGPLAGKGSAQTFASNPVTEYPLESVPFSSLDALQPEPTVDEAAIAAHLDEAPFVSAPASFVSTNADGGREVQITLKAVFANSGPFTLDSIATLTAKLPGITSCIIKAPGRTVLATAEPESVQSMDKMVNLPQPEMYQQGGGLLDLGRVDGVLLRSETGLASCFSFGGVSLMARHSGEDLEPGLWEKLILITQATASLH